jgi:hypothetical protein
MIRHALTAVVLLLGSLPVQSQDKAEKRQAKPPTLATVALKRFIEPKSCTIAEIDIDQIDTVETLAVIQTFVGGTLPPTVSDMFSEIVNSLKQAGVHRGYVIASPASIIRGSPVVVLPCDQPDDLQSILESFAKNHLLPASIAPSLLSITSVPSSEPNGQSFVLLGTGQAVQRAIETAKTLRPDFEGPLDARNHLAHTMIVSLAPETRRDLIAFWPARMPTSFPVQFSPRGMIEDIARIVISAELSPKPALQVQVTTENKEAAERVRKTLETSLALTGPIIQNIVIEFDGNDIHLSADMQPLLAIAGPLAGVAASPVMKQEKMNSLKQIGLAIHHYTSANRHLPPRCFTDPAGNPLHSWRVAILPFLEQRAVYDSLNLKEPWNSPANQNAGAIMIPIYANDAAGLDRTTLRAPVMNGSLWQGNGPPKQSRDITDGTSNTIAVIDAPKSAATAWANPEPWIISAEDPMSDIFGDRETFTALFLDGSVRTFKKSEMTNERLRAMFTIAAGDEI